MQQNHTTLDNQALFIATEIFNSVNQYTHDSNIAKFFLTDTIATVCYGVAGGFASLSYVPTLKESYIKELPLLSFYYTLLTYGFNVYLKERSIKTNGAPYTIPTDKRIIRREQKKVLAELESSTLISTPLTDKIVAILLENIKKQMKLQEFHVNKHRLSTKKFWAYTNVSLYWGYNFARHLLREDTKVRKTK